MKEKSPGVQEEPKAAKDVIRQYLSYQDAKIDKTQKENSLRASLKADNANKYASALLEIAQREGGMKNVLKVADRIRTKMLHDADILDMPLTPYAKSRTWAMWDIGKQYYLFKNPTESSSEYRDSLADPLGQDFQSEEKQAEIINRHLGWEAHVAYINNSKGWADSIKTNDLFVLALPQLEQETKPDRQLTSAQLADLGRELRRIVPNVAMQKEQDSLDRHAAETAAVTAEAETASPASMVRAESVSAVKPIREVDKTLSRPLQETSVLKTTPERAPISISASPEITADLIKETVKGAAKGLGNVGLLSGAVAIVGFSAALNWLTDMASTGLRSILKSFFTKGKEGAAKFFREIFGFKGGGGKKEKHDDHHDDHHH